VKLDIKYKAQWVKYFPLVVRDPQPQGDHFPRYPNLKYARSGSFLMSMGFDKSKVDSNLYFKVVGGRPVLLLLYGDDLFLTGGEKLIVNSRRKLAAKFEMKDLGMLHYFLGLEIWQRSDGTFLNQGKHAVDILKRFGMLDCKAISTSMVANLKLLCVTTSKIVDATIYRKMIGSLMYLTNTRPYICFAVNTLSRYMVKPRHVHLIATKHVMRYLKGTIDYGLIYISDREIRL
jgi:hypothetical protein